MTSKDMLERVKDKTLIDIIHSEGCTSLCKNNNKWRVKTFLGTLLYTDEELVKEMEDNWKVKVIDII